MDSFENIIDKYSDSVLKNLNKENMNKILNFLINEKCDFLDSIIEDYLDLFTIEYNTFVETYNKLNKQYNNRFLEFASEDMNLLEKFFYD